MVKNLTNVAPVEQEVGMAEMHKCDPSDENDQPRVVSLARGLERVITNLVTVGQIVDAVLFLPGVPTSVAGKIVIVAVAN